jgi:hypothetical protein
MDFYAQVIIAFFIEANVGKIARHVFASDHPFRQQRWNQNPLDAIAAHA